MFVDLVKMEVEAGKGGDGIVAYRRELKVDRGGPFGGSGGIGGSIIFVGDEGLSTLLDLRYNRVLKATPGEKGRTKGQTGACAEHTYVRVPVGTVIYDDTTGLWNEEPLTNDEIVDALLKQKNKSFIVSNLLSTSSTITVKIFFSETLAILFNFLIFQIKYHLSVCISK